MKKLFLSLTLLAGLIGFNACSTDVDLYAGYKEIPVIYGLMDASADTNYVKIVRAFSGSDEVSVDATQVALIADSCNYPGKLDAKIYRYKRIFGNEFALDDAAPVIELDTITINDKEPGAFYYPNQRVYYTTASFTPSDDYFYRLEVVVGNDTISSETGIVGGENFKVTNSQVSFMLEDTEKTAKINFMPADNATVYNMEVSFRYKKMVPGESPVFKIVRYSFGMKNLDEIGTDDGILYYVTYSQNLLFNMLRADIANDPLNTSYTYDPKISFVISLAAGGEELYNYIQINQGAGGLSQNIPDYTNINGGYGVFSSRINIVKEVRLSARAQSDMTSFGFAPEDF